MTKEQLLNSNQRGGYQRIDRWMAYDKTDWKLLTRRNRGNGPGL